MAAPSTIARLPPEILRIVFEDAFGLGGDSDTQRSETRTSLLSTCAGWRAVALETRVLWSSLLLHTRFGQRWPELIDTCLARSGNSLLTVTIMGRPGDPLPDVAARLGPMIARVRAFCVGGGSATLVALRDYLAHPAPELVSFMATAVDTEPDARLVFFPSAPKLEYLYWRGFVLTLRSPLLALETANFEAGSMGELVRVALVSLNLIAMILHLTAPIVHPPLPLRTVLHLDLTCHAPISAACLRAPVLHSAVLKFTEPGIVDLHMLGVFLQGSGARLAQLELSFAGDFTELAAALAPCAQLRELTLGNIGWATSFVAAFLRDMARADPAGEWICAQLEELKLRVVELESAVRTNLVGLAEARCASVPAGERPLSPLRFIEVVRSDEGNDLSRRKNYSALNKKLHEILATD